MRCAKVGMHHPFLAMPCPFLVMRCLFLVMRCPFLVMHCPCLVMLRPALPAQIPLQLGVAITRVSVGVVFGGKGTVLGTDHLVGRLWVHAEHLIVILPSPP
jgi:hypothetical protein